MKGQDHVILVSEHDTRMIESKHVIKVKIYGRLWDERGRKGRGEVCECGGLFILTYLLVIRGCPRLRVLCHVAY